MYFCSRSLLFINCRVYFKTSYKIVIDFDICRHVNKAIYCDERTKEICYVKLSRIFFKYSTKLDCRSLVFILAFLEIPEDYFVPVCFD